MNLQRLESLSSELDQELDSLVDAVDRWRDVPLYYFCPDDGWGARFEMTCSYCGSQFWPIFWDAEDHHGGWRCDPFYYQAGFWFGNAGEGYHFPICSDGCHDSLHRQLNKRMIHTKAQMQSISRARRLIRECRAAVKRACAQAEISGG